jgi:plastocyanin
MDMKQTIIAAVVSLSLTAGSFLLTRPASAIELTQRFMYPGDLLRGSSSAIYYYGSDGQRWIFPNEKTYFTWYPDFSRVKTVSDSELARLPLGKGNVTYRPGKKMVKVPTDPRVYVVDRGGILRHVLSEELAETLFGLNWKSVIEDIPEDLFANYTEGPPITLANQYVPSDVLTLTTTIDQDKRFPEKTVTINIGTAGVGFTPPTFSVKSGTTIRWVNTDVRQHQLVGADGWVSSVLRSGQAYEHVFSEIGSHTYSDLISRSMEGNINVIE